MGAGFEGQTLIVDGNPGEALAYVHPDNLQFSTSDKICMLVRRIEIALTGFSVAGMGAPFEPVSQIGNQSKSYLLTD